MRIKRFFLIRNYLTQLNVLFKKLKIKKLERKKFSPTSFLFTWKCKFDENPALEVLESSSWCVFGYNVNLENAEWSKDYSSGFVYPNIRIDKIHPEKWYDKGIEIKFPWELSRFYFAVTLGQKYLITKNKIYYKIFQELVIEWIDKNKFLYGVNWMSTMEVSIRAINWIVSINYFSELFDTDNELKDKITLSLSQHAEFIYTFPEVYENGLTTNHTTAGYAGLLFLGLTLKDHPKSKLWIDSAISGLEKCISDQVYEDGANFEGSIPYHCLVLEIFAFSAIAALANKINFSNNYYTKLFKMFEFTAAYLDENGNAPQIGDNDSGRCLIFNCYDTHNQYNNEFDHSYLLAVGERIFNYKFRSQCSKEDLVITRFLPSFKQLSINELNIKPRKTESSIAFTNAGAYFLKNEKFSFLLPCFPLGQRGKGGHNHLDVGSYTLSINGKLVIVDPGTSTYSTNKKKRDRFRLHSYHNTIHSLFDNQVSLGDNGYWSLGQYYTCDSVVFRDDHISCEIKFIKDNIKRFRNFILTENTLVIRDQYESDFYSRINLNPHLVIISKTDNKIEFDEFSIEFINAKSITLSDYEYSPYYGKVIESCCILILASTYLEILINIKS